MKQRALTKLWVKWYVPQNGYTTMTYYSFETPLTVKTGNLLPGAERLLKLLHGELKDKYEVAILYDNQRKTKIKMFINGQEMK